MSNRITLSIIAILALIGFNAEAKLVLPSVISDGMIIQQGSTVRIWGKGVPGESVKISPSWTKELSCRIDKDGNWTLEIDPAETGGPYSMTISDFDSCVEIRDILAGEVWICAGQSNMSMPVAGFQSQPCKNPLERAIESGEHSNIRMFTAERSISEKPEFDVKGEWLCANPENTLKFSAVGYYFALNVSRGLGGIPVGMINLSWGGSNVEAWSSRELLKMYPEVDSSMDMNSKSPMRIPTALHNAMFRPVCNYSIKGFVWYQGENNRNNRGVYASLFPDMIQEWRQLVGLGDIPFYYAQIAPYSYSDENAIDTPLMMEIQWKLQYIIPQSGVAVTLDLGEKNQIHYADKESLGLRLALLALTKTYGFSKIPATSPSCRSIRIEDNKAIISFDNAECGLLIKDFENKNPFEINGDDEKFLPAKAMVNPKRKNEIVVWSDEISNPRQVRYAFRNWSEAILFSNLGLPVPAFRTDNKKY